MKPKWEVEDLVLKHVLEPTLKTLYVEGTTDKIFFEWIFSEECIHGVDIFPIDQINISKKLFKEFQENGFPPQNNKGEVIILSMFFEKEIKKNGKNILCLVDTDFDELYNVVLSSDFLIYTDFADMEGYFFTPKSLKKFFKLFFGIELTKSLFKSIVEVSSICFFIMAIKEKKKYNFSLPKIDRHLKLVEQKIIFDFSTYITNFLTSNQKGKTAGTFIKQVNGLIDQYSLDKQKFLHGKQTLKIIRWVAKTLKIKNTLNHQDTISPGLRTSSEIEELKKFPLFKNLLKKFKN